MKLKHLFLFASLLCPGILYAQTTITTNHVNNNGNGGVTFHVQNTNVYDIVVTEIQCHLGSSSANACQLLTRSTPLTDLATPWDHGTIGDGQNGWVRVATSTISSNTANGIVPAISDMEVIVPAGTTVGFAFCATTIQYMTLTNGGGANLNTFSGGGVNLLTGDGISWGSTAYPATPTNYPRGFIGGITFEQAIPCTSPPTAGSISVASNTACPSVPTLMSVASGGVGQTYQWQSSPTNGNFTSIGGATSRKYTASLSDNVYIRCYVTCGGLSDTTAAILMTVPETELVIDTTVCNGESVTLNSSTYTTTGNYTQTLSGASVSGCDSIITINLTVLDPIENTSNVTICANGSYSVGANTYTTEGTYTDVLVSAYGCDSTENTELLVSPAQNVSTTFAGATMMADVTGATYTWLDVDNGYAVIAGETGQTYTASMSGNYAVKITEGACSDTSAVMNITVTDLTLYQSNGMAFSVSPNPAALSATVSLTGVEYQNGLSQGIQLSLVNPMNETIFSTVLFSDKVTLDLSNYESGIYFLQLKNGERSMTKKLVKN